MITLAKDFTALVPDILEEFMKLKNDPNVQAIYFKRSEESGRIIYPSFVTKSDDIKRMKVYLLVEGEYRTTYGSMNWTPMAVGVYYYNVNDRGSYNMVSPLMKQEGFKLFDKRVCVQDKCGKLSGYVREYLAGDWIQENCLLTDFPQFDWDYKKEFLNESLDDFPLSDDLIYFAALVHYLASEYFIEPPAWVLQPRYYSLKKLGEVFNEDDVPVIFKSHNYLVEQRALERV